MTNFICPGSGLRLALLAAATAAAGAACSGERQVVLELTGAAPEVDRLEISLLDPVVLAKRQAHNLQDANQADRLETAFYMAERSRTSISLADLQAKSIAGLQLELRGAGGPYVPLVAAVAGDQVRALGVYDPASIFAAPLGKEHTPAAVSAVSDVTIFPIELEAVDRAFLAPAPSGPQLVRPREVMGIPCAGDGQISGLVWRRADLRELRVLAALPGVDGDRLQPADLDCDQHSPGPAGLPRGTAGDELDCDDTSPLVHAAARERCSRVDEDCNPETTLSPVPCTRLCGALNQICVCDDAGEDEACTASMFIEGCKLAATLAAGGAGRQICESAGPVQLPLVCAAGCELMIAWAPPGLEVAVADAAGQAGKGLGKWAQITDGKAFLSVKGTRPFAGPIEPLIARIRISTGTTTTTTNLTIPLALIEAPCGSPSPLACPLQ